MISDKPWQRQLTLSTYRTFSECMSLLSGSPLSKIVKTSLFNIYNVCIYMNQNHICYIGLDHQAKSDTLFSDGVIQGGCHLYFLCCDFLFFSSQIFYHNSHIQLSKTFYCSTDFKKGYRQTKHSMTLTGWTELMCAKLQTQRRYRSLFLALYETVG